MRHQRSPTKITKKMRRSTSLKIFLAVKIHLILKTCTIHQHPGMRGWFLAVRDMCLVAKRLFSITRFHQEITSHITIRNRLWCKKGIMLLVH